MKKRLNNLSLYRIIATICILQFHIFFILYDRDIPYEMLMSKGVQGLTALSGFLYSTKVIEDSRAFILKAAKKLLPPAILCFLIMAAWNFVYMLAVGNYDYLSLFFDHRLYNGSLLVQPGNYYYILYIFICYLLTPYLAKGNKHRAVIAVIVATVELLLGFLFGTSIIATAYIVGYLVGKRWYTAYTDRDYKPKEILLLVLATAVSFLGYSALVDTSFGTGYFSEHLYSLLRNITSAAFGTLSFFLVAYIFKALNGENQIPILRYTDALSLNIFLLNQTFMCGAMNVAAWVDSRPLGILLVYLFTIGTSVLVTFVTPYIVSIFDKKSLKSQ